MIRLILLLGLTLLLSIGCAKAPADEHADDHDDHDETGDHHEDGEHAETPTGEAGEANIRLHLDGLRGLTFTRVGEPQQEGVWASAEAVSDATAVAVVTAPAAGSVSRLLVRAGEDVTAGQTVAELGSAEVADLVARARTATAGLDLARSALAREELLLAAAATSQSEVETARAAVASARAEVEAARLSLAARGVDPEHFNGTVRLVAPVAGTLERWEIALGEGVESGRSLATIRQRAATRVRAELAPPGPSDWVVGSTTEVRRGDGTRWSATVEGLPAGLTADTRRYPYLLRLDAPPYPSPGTPLEVRVPLATGIVLPQEALQLIEGDWGVFVREGDEVVFVRVRRGAELGGDVLVLDGITAGVEVATGGAYLLRPLWMKQMGGGEQHAH